MRTNIVIDDELIKEAMTLGQLKTKKAAVEAGLRLLVQIKKQERIKNLYGIPFLPEDTFTTIAVRALAASVTVKPRSSTQGALIISPG